MIAGKFRSFPLEQRGKDCHDCCLLSVSQKNIGASFQRLAGLIAHFGIFEEVV
jgi:hypothetical protein